MKYKQIISMYPQLEGLGNDHLKVAWQIDQLRPSLLHDARIGRFEGREYLEIRISSPISGRDFFFMSNRVDFTYGYYFGHAHEWFEHKQEIALRNIIQFYDALISENIVAAILMHTRELRKKKIRHYSARGLYSIEHINSISDIQKVYIASWTGKYDRIYNPEEFAKYDL